MKTLFNVQKQEWKGNTVDRLAKHDLVFGTPVHDPMAGLALGDGDVGSLLWMSEDTLHIHVNKCDLWDDTTIKNDVYCSDVEENLTCLRHGGEITVKLNTPCFDIYYQDTYETRLSLADATGHIHAHSAFGNIDMKAFASSKAHVSILEGAMTFEEEESPEICLSRFGSRSFSRWYGEVRHLPYAGLDGTEAVTEGNRLYITQKLNGTNFCIGMHVDTEGAYEVKMKNGHSCALTLKAAKTHKFKIYYTIVLGENTEDAKHRCAEQLSAAIAEGSDALHQVHTAEWKDFWNRSYIDITDDYIENIYYLSLYYSNCECRGAYPPHFTSGIWGFRHDFLPWTYYFFYNMQHMYGPLNAAGHGDLAENYYRMRRNGLDAAYRYAKEVKHLEGAFYHDVVDYRGRGITFSAENMTPASQIAMAMWRYYRFTGDEKFLKEIALPVMKGAGELYRGMLSKGDDGLYHLPPTSAYEANAVTTDTITDLAMIRVLFPILRDLAETEEEKAQYDDYLNHLPDFVLVPMEEEDWDGEKLLFGIGAGTKAAGDGKVFSHGINYLGKHARRSYGDKKSEKANIYGFPDVEMAPLYPSGLMGLAEKGTPLFDAMTNQVLLHQTGEECMHWCMESLYLARMGMGEHLMNYIRSSLNGWQVFPNGFSGDSSQGTYQIRSRWHMANSRDLDTNARGKLLANSFRYFAFETTPIAANATSESLLQSYDGILRICPAVNPDETVSFRLYAEGGFAVQSEVSPAGYVVTVESFRKEPCFLKLPEYADTAALHLYRLDGEKAIEVKPVWREKGREVVLDLTDSFGDFTHVLLCSEDIANLETVEFVPAVPNDDMKTCGSASLGSPRLLHALKPQE